VSGGLGVLSGRPAPFRKNKPNTGDVRFVQVFFGSWRGEKAFMSVGDNDTVLSSIQPATQHSPCTPAFFFFFSLHVRTRPPVPAGAVLRARGTRVYDAGLPRLSRARVVCEGMPASGSERQEPRRLGRRKAARPDKRGNTFYPPPPPSLQQMEENATTNTPRRASEFIEKD
jgi:hypothetical protein